MYIYHESNAREFVKYAPKASEASALGCEAALESEAKNK